MRIATWNVWWQFGPWRERQALLADVLADLDADVVCLQEVWAEVGGSHQASLLAAAAGLAHWRFATRFADRGVWIGNAILSRWPLIGASTWRLPVTAGQGRFRTALVADVDDGSRAPTRVVTAHLTYRRSQRLARLREARMVRSLALGGARGPVVVAGDLNGDPDDVGAHLLAEPPLSDAWAVAGNGDPGWTWDRRNGHTARSRLLDRRLDYVLAGGVDVAGVSLFGDKAADGLFPSDHFGVVADLV